MNNFHLHPKSEMMAKLKDQPTQILARAQKLFWKNGFKKTTMDSIAKEMGISKKTLYKHYPSKLDLLEGIFRGLVLQISRKIDAILDNEHLPFLVQVRSIHTTLTAQLSKVNPTLLMDLKENLPNYYNQLKGNMVTHSKGPVQRFIQKGKEEGQIHGQVENELGALLCLSFFQNLLEPDFLFQISKENPKQEPKLSDLADQFFLLYFEGVLTADAKEDLKGLT